MTESIPPLNKELTLRPNSWRWLLVLGFCAVFVRVGSSTIGDGKFAGWFVFITFAVGAAVAAVQLLPQSSYLKLTREHFEMRTMYRSHVYKWEDVSAFRPVYLSGNQSVGFDLLRTEANRTMRDVSVSLSGSEAALPETYQMTAEALVALMNEWRSRRLDDLHAAFQQNAAPEVKGEYPVTYRTHPAAETAGTDSGRAGM